MKFCAIIISLFLVGSCSCQSSEQLPKKKFSIYDKIKKIVSSKMTELVDDIIALENSIEDDIVDERTLPQFSDPLIIGNFDQVPILMVNDGLEKVDYKGVEFYGLGTASKAKYRIDNNKKEVILSIPLTKAGVGGHYTAFNRMGNFMFHLWDNVTYIQTIQYSYPQNGAPVQLQLKTSQAFVHFDNSSVEFESPEFGIFDGDLLRGDRTIGLIMNENVFGKVFEEINPKMVKNIEAVIQNWIRAVANRLDSGLLDIIDEIHEAIPVDGAVQVDLGIHNSEFEHNNTKIKISSIKLSGIEHFYLNESSVYPVGFFIGADFKFMVPKPNVSVIFTYQNGGIEKQIMAEYAVKHIVVDLVLGKDNIDATGVYGAELQNCVFGVAQIQPYPSQFLGKNNFEESVIRNSTTHLYPLIAEAIEQFFATEVYFWVSRRTNGPKYFRRLRNNNTNFSDNAEQYYEIEVLAMPIRKN